MRRTSVVQRGPCGTEAGTTGIGDNLAPPGFLWRTKEQPSGEPPARSAFGRGAHQAADWLVALRYTVDYLALGSSSPRPALDGEPCKSGRCEEGLMGSEHTADGRRGSRSVENAMCVLLTLERSAGP
jgi:hypothetical protein